MEIVARVSLGEKEVQVSLHGPTPDVSKTRQCDFAALESRSLQQMRSWTVES